MFDYFVGELRCPKCGAVSKADHSTQIQTKARKEPKHAYLGVGDALTVDHDEFVLAAYIPLNAPAPGGHVHIVERWFCPSCETPNNWVEIVVSDDVITAIEPLPGIGPRLERAHYVIDWILDELDDEGADAALCERLVAAQRKT
jgi:rubredoxin